MTDGARRARRRLALGTAMALAAVPLAVAVAPPATAAQTSGTVWTWGADDFGQLGNGKTSGSPSAPAPVAGLSDVVSVDGGREHVVALTASGQVFTWGSNEDGQLGLGDAANRTHPTQVTVPCGASGVAQTTAGHYSTLARCGDGTVWAWGLNADGQLGDGTRTNRSSPGQVQGITDAVYVDAGRDMSYAIRANGTVLAWGDNAHGELGDGTRTDRLTPVAVSGLSNVASIAAGRDHGLALRTDGSVWAFGWNVEGQLGDGTTTDRLTPVQVETGVQQVAAGADHSYALTTSGQVLSWGRNDLDELGDGTQTMRTSPVPVVGVSNAVSIGSGRDHGMAVMADGSVMTWGYNANDQLGDGTTTNRAVAVTVPGVSGASEAGGGGYKYSVVLVSGTVANKPPTARFTYSCQQLGCSFDGSGSTDTDGTITAYSWDFGDSTGGAGSTVTHSFATSGTYPVTLTVTDDDGATGTMTAQVTVSDASPPPGIALDGVGMSNGNVKQPSVQVPGTVASGDELVLFVSTGRNANAVAPAGWTRQKTVTNGVLRSWVFTAVAGAGTAGSTVQLTLDAASQTSLTLFAYSGAGAPTVIQGASQPGNVAKHKTPAAAVATAGSTVVSYWVDTGSTLHSWSLPATVTSRSATEGTGSGLVTSAAGDSAALPSGMWPGATADAGNTSAADTAVWTIVLPPA